MIVVMMRHRDETDRPIGKQLFDLGDRLARDSIAARCLHHEDVVPESDDEYVVPRRIHRIDAIGILREWLCGRCLRCSP